MLIEKALIYQESAQAFTIQKGPFLALYVSEVHSDTLSRFSTVLQRRLPSADSRRAVVGFWRKSVHNAG